MICNKKNILPHSCPVQKKYSLQICLTGSTRDVGHRKRLSWDQDDCSLWRDWGIGHKNDCEMRVDKGSVGPWNIDLNNK